MSTIDESDRLRIMMEMQDVSQELVSTMREEITHGLRDPEDEQIATFVEGLAKSYAQFAAICYPSSDSQI